ncbi:MAG: cupin domain-containing protein [Clostridia bacterium]|nr:cupin domain-containing protein [Clostridia bacterium]
MDKNFSIFPLGEKNDAYAKYFTGQSYLKMLSTEQVGIANVTFEAGCRNNWHIHRAEEGGGQILLVTAGKGWYCEWGKPPRALKAGDVVNIPANVKHWHGAAKDSAFSHLAVEVSAKGGSTEWLEPVSDEEYLKL